jgi:hypothetical protein
VPRRFVAILPGEIPLAIDQTDPEAALKTALITLESCLLTPIVSGELVGWIGEVRKSWADVASQTHEHAKRLHPQQYEQIAIEDPELLPKTEDLKVEDDAIDIDRNEFDRLVCRIAEHAQQFEPNEERITDHTTALVADGIKFIIRVRKQEQVLQTWFVEAFLRDRGVAD